MEGEEVVEGLVGEVMDVDEEGWWMALGEGTKSSTLMVVLDYFHARLINQTCLALKLLSCGYARDGKKSVRMFSQLYAYVGFPS